MATRKVIELEVKTDKAIDEIEALKAEVQKLNKTVAEGNKKTEEGFKNVEDASKGTAKALRGIGTAIKAIGIGLLLEAFNLLKETLGKNQKAVDFFNTAFETLSLIFNDFINFIDQNFGKITGFFKDIFENPLENIKKLGDLIKENIIERFNSALEVIGYLADAFKNLFAGEFEKAFESVKAAGVEFADVLSGIDNSVEKFTEGVSNLAGNIADYATETYNAAKANVELANSAELAAVKNQGLIEQYDRQAEQLRQVRDDERNSIEERIAANDELGRVLQEQQKLMLANAAIQVQAAEVQLSKNAENIEYQKAYLEALNEQAAIQAQIAGFTSEQLTNEMALQKEQIELKKSVIDADAERELERKLFYAEQNNDEVARLELLKQTYANEDTLKTERLQKDIEQYKEGTQARADAEIAYKDFIQESELRQLDYDAQIAEKRIANKQAEAEKIEEIEAQKRQSQQATLDNAIAIAGEESDLGKALLIAKQVIAAREAIIEAKASAMKAVTAARDATVKAAGAGVDVASGAAKTSSSVPFPANIPLLIAYAAQAVGIISAVKAATRKVKGAGAPSIGSVSTSAPSLPQAVAPQINTVGTSGVNQIAEAINTRPIKAYVVSKDVSSAQEMDRNIVREAGI